METSTEKLYRSVEDYLSEIYKFKFELEEAELLKCKIIDVEEDYDD